eukprot:362270-Chlamydomonas_euryale.AAC.7
MEYCTGQQSWAGKVERQREMRTERRLLLAAVCRKRSGNQAAGSAGRRCGPTAARQGQCLQVPSPSTPPPPPSMRHATAIPTLSSPSLQCDMPHPSQPHPLPPFNAVCHTNANPILSLPSTQRTCMLRQTRDHNRRIHAQINTHMHKHTRVDMLVHARTHARAHAQAHTHTHTHTQCRNTPAISVSS